MSDIAPCLAILAFFIPLFILIIILRLISYRETIVLAEKGLVKPPKQSDGKDSLRWGIVITAIGMALCMGLWPLGTLTGNTYPFGLGPWMMVGIVPTFFGLALILIFILTYDRSRSKPQEESQESEELSEIEG